ncbi:hypothetical protein [Sporosalibacterium faouarense]|nr:hypothetical protein [Sporosalibacterium faouarense]
MKKRIVLVSFVVSFIDYKKLSVIRYSAVLNWWNRLYIKWNRSL